MSRRPKVEVVASGEVMLAGEAVFEPLPPADGTEKTSVPLGSVFYAKSGGYGPHDGGPDQSADMPIRYPAVMLRKAIEAARAEGYVVQMPFRIEDLDRISVSATAKTIPTT